MGEQVYLLNNGHAARLGDPFPQILFRFPFPIGLLWSLVLETLRLAGALIGELVADVPEDHTAAASPRQHRAHHRVIVDQPESESILDGLRDLFGCIDVP